MKKWISLAIRLIFLFIVFDYLWGLVSLDSLPEPIKRIAGVFVGPIVILGMFISLSLKFFWKLPIIGAPIRLLFATNPVLFGTWGGTLEYEYDGRKQTKKAFLVILQPDALAINCWLFTDERKSESDVVSLVVEKGIGCLTYTYRSEEAIENREKNPSHIGATVLQLDSSAKRFVLDGFYCTTRKSIGSMRFIRSTNRVAYSYEAATRLCGI